MGIRELVHGRIKALTKAIAAVGQRSNLHLSLNLELAQLLSEAILDLRHL